MKRYKTIIFDLDGTLTDPGLGITNSVAYALEKLGIRVPPREQLYKFIGPPLADSFMGLYGLDSEGTQRAISLYREYFAIKGIYENALYRGIPELLTRLNQEGKTLLVATTKPEFFALQVLDYFDLTKHFAFVGGSHLDGRRTKKDELIPYALSSAGIADLSTCVMVGDREHDIIGAAASGIDSVGVLYGFGSLEELQNANATYLAKNVESLYGIL